MYREILTQLEEWKEKENKKVLLLAGAKGVGKTWTLEDFGAGFYGTTAMFDLKEQEYARFIFTGTLEKDRILKMLSVTCGENIVPGETLIVLENIDTMENYVEVIKLMSEEMKEYDICVTTIKNENTILRENKVLNELLDIIVMYPLSFSEFLRVNGDNDLCEVIESNNKKNIEEVTLKRIKEYMKVYMLIGGLPEVVKTYVDTGSIKEAESVKSDIIFGYLSTFESIESKPLRVKVKQVWDSVAKQLGNENKKFQYGMVKLTARAREYKDAVEYLVDGKFLTPMYKIKNAVSPLVKSVDDKSFELFFNDIGVLSSMYGLTLEDFEDEKKVASIHNGAIIEQYVFEELKHNPNVPEIYYWTSDATAKINFVFDDGETVIPVEINLYENPKAQSLKVYRSRYNNNISVRITQDKMSIASGVLSLPLFSIWNL